MNITGARLSTVFTAVLMAAVFALGTQRTAHAVPPLPMTVCGTAQLDSANVADGTAITAWLAGAQRGETVTQTHESASVYCVDVAGPNDWDPNAGPPDTDGQSVSFKLGSVGAQETTNWSSGALVVLDLSATSGGQTIAVQQNWNLISTYVSPWSAVLTDALGNIDGQFDRVLGESGLWDADLDLAYLTLNTLEPGRAYYMRLPAPAPSTASITGTPIAADTPLELHAGWNWVGYLPADAQGTRAALASIDGLYQRVLSLDKIFIPAIPDSFSTLKELTPGDGYLIYMNEAATLVYPAPAQSGALSEPQTPATCGGVQPTPAATLVYGYLTVNGEPAPLGVRVEVLTPGGDVAGCFEVTTAGQYGLMHVYGADDTADPPIPGFRDGETLRFRVAGVETAPAATITWQDDKAPHQADLSVDGVEFDFDVYMPLIVRPAEMQATQADTTALDARRDTLPPADNVGEQYLPFIQR